MSATRATLMAKFKDGLSVAWLRHYTLAEQSRACL